MYSPFPAGYDPAPKNEVEKREADWLLFWAGTAGIVTFSSIAAMTQTPGILFISALFLPFLLAGVFKLLTPKLKFKGKIRTDKPVLGDLSKGYNKFLRGAIKAHVQGESTTAASPERQSQRPAPIKV